MVTGGKGHLEPLQAGWSKNLKRQASCFRREEILGPFCERANVLFLCKRFGLWRLISRGGVVLQLN